MMNVRKILDTTANQAALPLSSINSASIFIRL